MNKRKERVSMLEDPGYFVTYGRVLDRGKMPSPGSKTNLKFALLAVFAWFAVMGGLYLAVGWRFMF